MLTGQIISASVRKLPSRLAIILVALGLLNIDDCARRCCFETQMIQTEARARRHLPPQLWRPPVCAGPTLVMLPATERFTTT
jgi:hypothetical protein